jgi:hypothetical protein
MIELLSLFTQSGARIRQPIRDNPIFRKVLLDCLAPPLPSFLSQKSFIIYRRIIKVKNNNKALFKAE